MGFALNLLALIIVLGLCWAAMVWYSARGHAPVHPVAHHGQPAGSVQVGAGEPCPACDSIGATRLSGRLEPCVECGGTGVMT